MSRGIWLVMACIVCGYVTYTAGFGQSLPKFGSAPRTKRDKSVRAVEVRPLRLTDFEPVRGTPFLKASLVEQDGGKVVMGLSSSTSSGLCDVVNHVFFNLEDDSTTTLLPNNNSLIVSMVSFPREVTEGVPRQSGNPVLIPAAAIATSAAVSSSPSAVQWHVVEVVSADTNGDGELTSRDNRSLAVADAGGQGLAEIIANLGDVFSMTMVDATTLHVIHGSQSRQRAVRIDLPTRKVISSKSLTNYSARGHE